MKSRLQPRNLHGFSLIELLMVVALISCLAAMAYLNLSDVRGNSEVVKTRQNARTICSLYQSARSVGATFSATTKEGILEELIDGKNGLGSFSKSRFQMSLADEERAPALAYCSYDAASELMHFDVTRAGKVR